MRTHGRRRAGALSAVGVAAELVALLEHAGAALALPRVRALHLPPPSAAGSKDGEFCALELDDGSCGLSYVLLDDTLPVLRGGRDGRDLAGADALALARGYAGGRGAQRAVGFAAVNALTRHLCDRAGFRPGDAADSIGGLDLRPGGRVGMIGLFPPLVKAIVARGAPLTVLELKAGLAGAHEGWQVTLDPRELAGCLQVLSTSTVLLNDTLDAVLEACRGAERMVLVGPGAGCLPDPLFARGVHALAGTWIEDADAFRAALLRGEPWGRHARKVMLERKDWPGFEAVLARAVGSARRT
ncbi:MAG TPA: DUF364 domain-containing protein [Burkholderiaceae bacterium]|nr:DUF364 domain-containing protein [Burkholderiaceae bacterium]